jgi:hypothetical protein
MERQIERKTDIGWESVQFGDLKYKDFLRVSGDLHLADGEYVTTSIWPLAGVIRVHTADKHRELCPWDYEGGGVNG